MYARDHDSIPGPVKSYTESATARHRCDVSSELCSPGAKPGWVPPLVTREYNGDEPAQWLLQ